MDNKKFAKNSYWIIGGTALKAVIGFVVSIITARYLGPSNYGVIGYVNTITNLFSAFATLGLANVILKEYVNNKEENGKITGTAISLQFISSFISYIFIVATILIFNPHDKSILICAFIQGAYHIFNCFDCINYYYQSQLKSKYPIIISLSAYLVVQVFKIFLFLTNKGIYWFSLAFCLEPLAISLLLVVIYILKKGPKLGFSKSIAKRILKQSLPFIIAGTIAVLYASIDKIMLKEIFKGTEEVGYYNVGHSISYSWVFLLNAVISSFSVLIYESYKTQDKEANNLKSRQLYFIVFYISFIVSILLTVVAPFLMPIFYGEAYTKAIMPAIILSWSVAFAYVGSARIIQITSENLQKYTILFSISTVILNVILNLLFIPKLGATGAALGTLLSEMFVCLIVPLFFKKTRHIGFNVINAMFIRNVNLKGIKNTALSVFKKKNSTKGEIKDEPNDESGFCE